MGAWIGISIGATITASVGFHDWKTAVLVCVASGLSIVLDRKNRHTAGKTS